MGELFDWDEWKDRKNLRKHGLGFSDASTVFDDPFAMTAPDIAHSDEEDRWITLGRMRDRRIIVLIHADRDDKIRIISARLATRSEAMSYERRQQRNG